VALVPPVLLLIIAAVKVDDVERALVAAKEVVYDRLCVP
jgi:hypothetical protein